MALKTLILNIVLDIVYLVCVTEAAMYFHNPKLLWWYLLVLLLGYNLKVMNKNE